MKKRNDVSQLIRRAENARRAGRLEPRWTEQEESLLAEFYKKRLPSEEAGTPWEGGERLLTYTGGKHDVDIATKYALKRLPKLKARSAECQSEYVKLYNPRVVATTAASSAYPTQHGTVRERMTDAVKQVLGEGGRPMLPGDAVMHARRLKDTFTCEVFMVTIDPQNRRVDTWWVPGNVARDSDTVLRYSERIPMGFVVLIDRTKPGDEDLSVRSCRVDCYSNEGCKNIMDDAQRRIHEMVQDWIYSRQESEMAPA